MMKRVNSFLCAAAVAFSGVAAALPAEMTAFAAEEAATSGKCGENLTWEFDKATGTLTISGEGEMDDDIAYYHSQMGYFVSFAEWNPLENEIKSVVIEEGVTSVSACAFMNEKSGGYGELSYQNLTSVTIPSTVTEIGNNAFLGTPWLNAQKEKQPFVIINGILVAVGTASEDKVLKIPDTVKVIGGGSLMGVKAEAYVIPDSVTAIMDYAFCRSQASSIELPNSVIYIGKQAFASCQMTAFVIPDSVTSIGELCFDYCNNLESITIPESITDFGACAFTNTPWVKAKYRENPLLIVNHVLVSVSRDIKETDITVPDTVTKVAEYAFGDVLHDISVTLPESVETIESVDYKIKTLTVLNPECKINDSGSINARIIRGYDNSTAQAYVEKIEEWAQSENLISECKFESLGAAPVKETPTGDFDGDGEITASDAQNLLAAYAEILAGGQSSLTDEQKKACDIDKDGEITAADAQYILIYYTENTVAGNPVSWEDIVK